MTDNPIAMLSIILLFFALILVLGIYLLFYKRKMPDGVQPTDWLDKLNLPPSAKSVRLKEINKQTEKIFTRKWFLEYWQGERTALSAWLTWVFLGGIITNLSLMIILLLISKPAIALVLSTVVFIYKILASIILWRCAKNSTPFNKYLARFIAVLNILTIFRIFDLTYLQKINAS